MQLWGSCKSIQPGLVWFRRESSPGEHGWCWQEDHSARSDRWQLQLWNQVQRAGSLPEDIFNEEIR